MQFNTYFHLYYALVTILSFGVTLLAHKPIDTFGMLIYMFLVMGVFGIINVIYFSKLSSLLENKYPILFDKCKVETPFSTGLDIFACLAYKSEFESLRDKDVQKSLFFIKKTFLYLVLSPFVIIAMSMCLKR